MRGCSGGGLELELLDELLGCEVGEVQVRGSPLL